MAGGYRDPQTGRFAKRPRARNDRGQFASRKPLAQRKPRTKAAVDPRPPLAPSAKRGRRGKRGPRVDERMPRARSIPRKGVSKTFRQFIEPPKDGRSRPTFAIVQMQFSYGNRKPKTFNIPLSMGPMTKRQIAKLKFADIKRAASFGTNLQRGTLTKVMGFAQLAPRSKRKGKKIH